MGEEYVTSIHLYDEFYVNLLFDRSIYRPMCTHMGHHTHMGYCSGARVYAHRGDFLSGVLLL